MKLCQKCVQEIDSIAYFEGKNGESGHGYDEDQPVPESECEFWAHKALIDFLSVTNIRLAETNATLSNIIAKLK